MLSAFICGNFNQETEDGAASCGSGSSSPKKSRRKESRDNNPYSSRGLDKFSALLADLDQRRQKVYSQMSPQDISFVRFAYSNTDDFVPIVVKVKNSHNHNNNKDQKPKSEELKIRHVTPFSEPMEVKSNAIGEELRNQANLESEKKNKKKKSSLYFSWNMLKRPSFYVPAVMILILVFLTVFGRSVATLCTCVLWYVVPTLSDSADSSISASKQRKMVMKKKKDYVRGLSEKKMVVPQGSLSSPTSGGGVDSKSSKDKSSGKHSHQKSW